MRVLNFKEAQLNPTPVDLKDLSVSAQSHSNSVQNQFLSRTMKPTTDQYNTLISGSMHVKCHFCKKGSFI